MCSILRSFQLLKSECGNFGMDTGARKVSPAAGNRCREGVQAYSPPIPVFPQLKRDPAIASPNRLGLHNPLSNRMMGEMIQQ
jgi:hypothetical protein